MRRANVIASQHLFAVQCLCVNCAVKSDLRSITKFENHANGQHFN